MTLFSPSTEVGGFRLGDESKSTEFPKGSCKLACNELKNKHSAHNASSLLKLRNDNNSKLDLVAKDPDE